MQLLIYWFFSVELLLQFNIIEDAFIRPVISSITIKNPWDE